MAFLVDTQELKLGLVIFPRADVKHRNWYCRMKVPRQDRYKTVSLKTADIDAARERAFDQDADLRFRIKHEVPIFNRPFSQIAKDYVDFQKERVEAGQITKDRAYNVESIIRAQLNPYVGPVQINLVGQDRWQRYPLWRRKHGKGINGNVSDATIRYEMSILRSIMAYALSKKYITDSQMFKGKLPLAKVQREEFTPEEYRKLHTFARGWIKKAKRDNHTWYRTVAYNFILIMCNTGMRPPEAKNLRWRDVGIRTDDQDRKFVVLHVRGKDKFRHLVAPGSVADYLDRIAKVSDEFKNKEGKPQKFVVDPDSFVFTTWEGTRAGTLYS
jgi:integrase